MNTVTTYRIKSRSSEETETAAAKLGEKLRGREVIVLNSDLGGGKTAYVRGLARGMGSTDHVSSPTFTISQQYFASRSGLTLYHFDFYRLADPGLIRLELSESLEDPQAVTAIEWSGVVQEVLPAERLEVSIVRTGDMARDIVYSIPSSLAYLIPEAT